MGLRQLLLLACPLLADDAPVAAPPPATLRWQATEDAPAPPLLLRRGELALALDGSARHQRFRLLENGTRRTLATLECELAGPPPIEERHEWLPFANLAAAGWTVNETVATREAILSATAPAAIVRWRGDGAPLDLTLRFTSDGAATFALDHVGGSMTVDGATRRVRGAFALVARLVIAGAPAIAAGWDDLLAEQQAARTAQLGDFRLLLGDPDALAAARTRATDVRLRALRNGDSDPDLVATWIELARLQLAGACPASDSTLLAAPARWLEALPPAVLASGAGDLATALRERERRDGDAAWAALRPRLALQSGPDLLPKDAPDPLRFQLEAAAMLAALLLDEQDDAIALLPALPRAWPDGVLAAWRTRSGVVVDASWRDGALATAVFTAPRDGTLQLKLPRGDYRLGEAAPAPAAAADGRRKVMAAAGVPLAFTRVR